MAMRLFAWPVVTGCTRISPGCEICPALDRLVTMPVGSAPRFHAAALGQPARLPAAYTVAVAPHGDLFHPDIPDAALDAVFDAMEADDRHSYQLLTKRAPRLAQLLRRRYPDGAPDNMVFGVSVERDQEARERLAALKGVKARRFVAAIPLLERLDLRPWLGELERVTGGPVDLEPAPAAWVADLEAQCAAAGVPFEWDGALL